MGFVEVTIGGEKQVFQCINCHPSSPSTELAYIYLDDSAMNGDLALPGAANCDTTCTFKKGMFYRRISIFFTFLIKFSHQF